MIQIECSMLLLSSCIVVKIGNQWTLGCPFYNELCCIFHINFCDANKNQDFKMVTGSPYLVLSERNLKHFNFPGRRHEWNWLFSRDCTESFNANETYIFFMRTWSKTHKKVDKKKPRISGGEFSRAVIVCLRSERYSCQDRKSKNTNLAPKDSENQHGKTMTMDQRQNIAKLSIILHRINSSQYLLG